MLGLHEGEKGGAMGRAPGRRTGRRERLGAAHDDGRQRRRERQHMETHSAVFFFRKNVTVRADV